jgi:quinol monooxygenase YgiN
MSDVISWNLQVSVREGHLEPFRALMEEMVAATRSEPGTLSYEWFLSADGTVCHFCERYADSAATLEHLGNFGSRFAERFLACVQPTSFAVYGAPNEQVRAVLDNSGAAYFGWFGGFSR